MKKQNLKLFIKWLGIIISIIVVIGLIPSISVNAGNTTVYNVIDYGAAADGTTDDTDAINDAIEAAYNAGGGVVYIPEGVYLIDASVSVILKDGIKIIGDGDDVSILKGNTTGGSIVKREFNPSTTNAYVSNIHISHIGIVLTHPATASPLNYYQIGFDFRHITRSTIEECYVGNYNRGAVGKTNGERADMVQGYGIVFGNVSSSDTAYCGGEVNSVIRCAAVGLKKGIVIDDTTLSPISAAHATYIENCDIQICESGIVQESRYTAGTMIKDCIVQAMLSATGSSSTTYFYRLEGYGGKISGGYMEDQDADADYVIYLGSNSRNNHVNLGYYSTDHGLISDNGTKNYIEYFNHSNNNLTKKYNKIEQQKAWVKFDSSGTVVASSGVSSVTKIGTGDFLINWSSSFPSSDYSASYMCQVNSSGNAGLVIIRSQTTSNIRIHTYKILNGGTVTQSDFDYVIVNAEMY